jgi:hypothetical protein
MRERTYVPPDALALAWLGSGDRDQAIRAMQRAATMKVAALAHLSVEPMWDAIRSALQD